MGDLGHGLLPRRRNGAVDLLHAATTNDTRADSVAASIVKIDRTLPYIYLPCNYRRTHVHVSNISIRETAGKRNQHISVNKLSAATYTYIYTYLLLVETTKHADEQKDGQEDVDSSEGGGDANRKQVLAACGRAYGNDRFCKRQRANNSQAHAIYIIQQCDKVNKCRTTLPYQRARPKPGRCPAYWLPGSSIDRIDVSRPSGCATSCR